MFDSLLESTILISVAAATLRLATPILFAALGEMVAERTGIYNMGLEGTMLMGAFTGYLGAYQTGSLWLGVACAALAGAIISLLFAALVITLKVEQIVTGLAINLLGSGLSIFWLRSVFAGESATPTIAYFATVPIPFLSEIPWLGPVLFEQKVLTYFALLAVPLTGWFLFR